MLTSFLLDAMQTSVRTLTKIPGRSFLIAARLFSSKLPERIQGIRENFSEYEVRLHFNEWLKSLW